jgi:protein-tyrosine phosphatase
MDRIRICFVCTGNICRSPTAEACFIHEVNKIDLSHRFEIDSAGTGGWHEGELAHAETRKTAKSRGVEITSKARQFFGRDFDRFDYVLAMDTTHVEFLRNLARTDRDRDKIHLFRDFDPASPKGQDVPDPYYSGVFEEVFEICDAAARGFLAHLREAHALR